MLGRVLLLLKHVFLVVVRVTCKILRCGRRKKVAIDESLPTDIVIGDAASNNYEKFSLQNGYEVPAPSYYDNAIAQQQKYPYQNQTPSQQPYAPNAGKESDDFQIETWEEWGYNDSTLHVDTGTTNRDMANKVAVNDVDTKGDMNFFMDMEPEVKVKKIFIKKKSRTNSERSNRLAVNQDLDFKTSSELDSWQDQEENDGGGWMDDDVDLEDIDTAKVAKEARELRKQERMQKAEEQKKLKLAKKPTQHHEHKLATKVS